MFYKGWASFPDLEKIAQYINIIHERMNRPNIYDCYYCCNQVDHGHDPITLKKNLHMHELICSGTCDFNRKNSAAKKIQRRLYRHGLKMKKLETEPFSLDILVN